MTNVGSDHSSIDFHRASIGPRLLVGELDTLHSSLAARRIKNALHSTGIVRNRVSPERADDLTAGAILAVGDALANLGLIDFLPSTEEAINE